MKIIISAESTIDLPQELLDKYNIKTTPFGINFNDKLVNDEFGISKDIFKFVEDTKKLPKTSAVPPEQYKEHFETLLKEHDAVIHFSISSLMSSAYNNACIAANELKNIYVIDTCNLSTGIALLAIHACELIDQGLSAEEVVAKTKEQINNVKTSFIIEKLNYLHKGGRCSAITLLGANIMKIKPQIIVNNGKMMVGKKYIGNLTKVVSKYCDDLLMEYPNADLEKVFITHSSPMPEIEQILENKLTDFGFKNIYNTYAGGTISSHCGPNCIGILFMLKD